MDHSASASQKRKREPKFEANERQILVESVQKYFHIIENKRTDGATTRQKLEAWKQIGILFNGSSGVYPRTWETLKTLWENLRRKARNVITTQNENVKGTGGGARKPVINDPLLDIVIDLIRPQVEPMMNPFDCDFDLNSQREETNGCDVHNCENFETNGDADYNENVIIDNANDVDSFVIVEDGKTDWSEYTPSMLRTPRSYILQKNKLEQHQSESVSESGLKTKDSKEQPDPTTPHHSIATAQRRRPVLKKAEAEALLEAKVSTLTKATQHSEQEHAVQMRILLLQEKQEMERLLQEKLKTALLRHQLRTETGRSLLEEEEEE